MLCMTTDLMPPLIDAPTVGGRIRQARRLRELTQNELADLVGFSRESVSSWERGKASPDVDDLIEVAKMLRIPVTTFVVGLDENDETPPDGGMPSGGDIEECAPWDSNPEPAGSRTTRINRPQIVTYPIAA